MDTVLTLALCMAPLLLLAAGLCKIAARESEYEERWMHIDDQGCEEGDHGEDDTR